MKAKYIIEMLDKWIDPTLIDTWDNTGFQIGSEEKDVTKALISLDLDKRVLDYAISRSYDMIITHHPIIFKPLKSIITNNPKENIIYELIKNQIVVYNAHTNLDTVEGGVSEELAKVLGLTKTFTLFSRGIGSLGYGKVGLIPEIKLTDYADYIKDKLKISHLTIYGDLDKTVKKVAVCGGAGAEFIPDAYKNDADVYITGDIKYHEAQLADEYGLTLIDIGHFHSEKVILPVIKEYLNDNLKDLITDIWNEPSPSYTIY